MGTTGDKMVIRAPFDVASGANVVRFHKAGGVGTSDRTIAAGTYVAKGETGTGTPTDLIKAFEAAAQAAHVALWGASATVLSVDLQPGGRIRMSQDIAGPGTIEIDWAASTLPPGVMSCAGGTDVIPVSPSYLETEFQAWQSWYPSQVAADDSGEISAHDAAMLIGPNRRPAYLVHSDIDNPARVRRISWDMVRSARVWAYWTADATAAAGAGVVASDPSAPIEWLVKHVLTGGVVYLYSSDDPATHTESGTSYLRLPPDWIDFGGVPSEIISSEFSQRRCSISLEFTR